MDIKDYRKAGVVCPSCFYNDIRSCDLGDSIYSALDHIVCNKCGCRFFPASFGGREPQNIEELKRLLSHDYVWVLHKKENMHIIKDE